MVVVWTPRPAQRVLWIIAALAVAVITAASFPGLAALGLRTKNFLASLWIVGAALLICAIAVAVASALHALRPLPSLLFFIERILGLRALVFRPAVPDPGLFSFPGSSRSSSSTRSAVVAAALLFAIAHLPKPLLTAVTLVWGFGACLLFLRYRNLYTLALAHAIVGITISVAIPGPVHHNMRVGLGYLTYTYTRPLPHPLPKP